MAGAAGPSLPGSAFWSRDCILCPAARGRRALPGGEGEGGGREAISGPAKRGADRGPGMDLYA